MRMLVAIANHGTKNQAYLARLLEAYRSMRHEVDLVVLSDAPKDLGPDIEVRVGAPTRNPWSLPFAHRRLFADRADAYDLFVYSEDDTLIEQQHVDAFVELNELLPEDEIPGFLRFEEHENRERSYCSIHSSYRWLPETVATHDGEVFASFSNEHSACYILTRDHLKRAIASGGFLVEAHEGEYDMLVSAATDPYTRCGLRRRICLSRVDDVLLHHLPNVYLGKLGVTETEFRAQLRGLTGIARGKLDPGTLIQPASNLPSIAWDIPQYPKASPELRSLVEGRGNRVLSIGCASGCLEQELFGSGSDVSVIPLDSVCAEVARMRSFRAAPPDLQVGLASFGAEEPFDVILLHHVLEHVRDPGAWLRSAADLIAADGILVVTTFNARAAHLRRLLRRPSRPVPRPTRFDEDGVHSATAPRVRSWGADAGLEVVGMRAEASGRMGALGPMLDGPIGAWTGDRIHLAFRSRGARDRRRRGAFR
jgi:2-polyprenyl-3-methyl-5-hydroxy-6-metoxy-1,4-benzoquinol methylase